MTIPPVNNSLIQPVVEEPVEVNIYTRNPLISSIKFANQFINIPITDRKAIIGPLQSDEKIDRLIKLGIPFNKKELSAILNKIKMLKPFLKRISPSWYPIAYEASIGKPQNRRTFRIEIYNRNDFNRKGETKKDILLTFFNIRNRIFTDPFRKLDQYNAWFLTKPKRVIYSCRLLEEIKEFGRAEKETRLLKFFNDKRITRSNLPLSQKIYKCAYFPGKISEHESQRYVQILKYYPDTLFEIMYTIKNSGLFDDKIKLDLIHKRIALLDDASKLKKAIAIAEIINYLHDNNIAHGDIKPENFPTKGEKIIITDFSDSYEANFLNGYNSSESTPEFTCPEMMEKKLYDIATPQAEHSNKISFAADIWSLGCFYYNFFSGDDLPWQNIFPESRELTIEAYLELKKQLKAFHKQPIKKSEEIKHLIWQMCSVNPLSRPSIKEVIAKLENMLKNLPEENTFRIFDQFKKTRSLVSSTSLPNLRLKGKEE